MPRIRLPANSIRLTLTLWNVCILAALLVVLGVALRYTLQVSLLASVDRDLVLHTRGMADILSHRAGFWSRIAGRQAGGPDIGPPQEPQGRFGRPGPGLDERPGPDTPDRERRPSPALEQLMLYRPRTYRLDGASVGRGPAQQPWDRLAITRAKTDGAFATVGDTRVYTLLVRHDGDPPVVIQCASSLAETKRDIQALSRTLLMLSPLALLIAGISGALMTERALRPVRDITNAAAMIGAKNLSNRLPAVGADEFSRLTGTMNGMLARIEAAFEQQRRFTADASHELRTPLTALMGRTTLALRGQRTAEEYRSALEQADRAAHRMNRLIQDLLLLARSDSGRTQLEQKPVAVTDVVQQALESIPDNGHAPIATDIRDAGLTVRGDLAQLVRVLTNLLENATRHTPKEGAITVSAESIDPYRVRIVVQDTGAGIPPEHLPHLGERFYRVDTARSRAEGGTGLGLAICRSIVEAHGGELSIASIAGEGTRVAVVLPDFTQPVAPTS